MRTGRWILIVAGLSLPSAHAGRVSPTSSPTGQVQQDSIRVLVSRLDFDRYKAALRGLAQFGDRREGTQRNRDAVTWIETQLESYGCTNTERFAYERAPAGGGGGGRGGRAAGGDTSAAGRGRAGAAGNARGAGRGRAGDTTAVAARGGAARGRGGDTTAAGARGGAGRGGGGGGGGGGGQQIGVPSETSRPGAGGKGFGGPSGANEDPLKQPDLKLRELNSGPMLDTPREVVYCTKIGATHPEEMYIVGAHMDGRGWGEAVNDDGSGTALVMEIARVFSSPGVTTDRSIRFVLWNSEEGGEIGSKAYVAARQALQGIENPPGSGKYSEPKWMGMIQHDMMMWDHGAPRADGTVAREQRPEADINIDFQANSEKATESMMFAWAFRQANFTYATEYPAVVGPKMQNTDSFSFKDFCPSISLREGDRVEQIGVGWDPNWHQATDMYSTYYDKDFRLGFNAAQTTLAGVARFAGVRVR